MPNFNSDQPAFPFAYMHGNTHMVSHGMSLRDWFAGQIISNVMIGRTSSDDTVRFVAESAYRLADALIVAREVRSAE